VHGRERLEKSRGGRSATLNSGGNTINAVDKTVNNITALPPPPSLQVLCLAA
jgi:hypothetical protein